SEADRARGVDDAVLAGDEEEERDAEAVGAAVRERHRRRRLGEQPRRDRAVDEGILAVRIDDGRVVTEVLGPQPGRDRERREQTVRDVGEENFPAGDGHGGSEPGRDDDPAAERRLELLQVAERDEAAHRVARQEQRAVGGNDPLHLPAEAVELLEIDLETRHVAAAPVGEAVAAEVEGEGRQAERRERLRETVVAAAVVREAVDEDDGGPRRGDLPAPVLEAEAVHPFERAVIAFQRRGRCHGLSSCPRCRQRSASAACAARSRTSSLSPRKRRRRASTASSMAIPIQTVPTGFSADPPPGPAIPVTETATSAPSARLAPTAISLAVSSLTAPCAASVDSRTPSSACFDSFEYVTSPPRKYADEPATSVIRL